MLFSQASWSKKFAQKKSKGSRLQDIDPDRVRSRPEIAPLPSLKHEKATRNRIRSIRIESARALTLGK